jgi:hypothetical protein
MDGSSLLGLEWRTLQNNHEQHEKNALLIKLASLTLCCAGLAFGLPLLWIGFTVLLCWGLEGIFKTYQARLSERLLRVEAMLGGLQPSAAPMQLHAEWAASRPGSAALIAGYALSAGRPTVAFPYLPILLMLGIDYGLFWN